MPDVVRMAADVALRQASRVPAMVGRDREMTLALREIESARSGDGSVIFVSGEPGIGKSRLASEIEKAAVEGGFRAARGGCFQNEAAIPFRPWRPVLKELCSLAAGRSLAVSLIREPPAIAMTPFDQVRLFDEVADLVFSIGESAPVLMTLEDLHWADHGTHALLRHLGRRLSQERLLIVCTYREGEASGAPVLGSTRAELLERSVAREVRLTGLSLPETAELVEALVPGTLARWLPSATQRLWRATDGNPFFVGELVRSLSSDRALGNERISDPLAGGTPPTIRHVLHERLQRLPPGTRRVLEVLAVLGRECPSALAEALTEATPGELRELLRPAVRAEFIEERPSGAYRFVHALVSQEILQEAAPERLAALHLRMADMLEADPGLADGPAVAGFLHVARAAPLAGERRLFEKARAALDELVMLGAVDDAVAVLESLVATVKEHRLDESVTARIVAEVLSAIAHGIEYERTRALCRFALPVLEQEGEERLAALVKLALAFTYQSSGRRELMDFAEAVRLIDEAVPALESHGDLYMVGFGNGMRANALFQLGHCEKALELMQAAARSPLETTRMGSLALSGFYLMHLGRLDQGRRALEDGWAGTNDFIGRATAYFFHHVTLLWRLRAPNDSLITISGELRGGPGRPPNPDPRLLVSRLCAHREMGLLPTEAELDLMRFTPEVGDEGREAVQTVRFRNGEWPPVLSFYRELYQRTKLCGAPQVVPMVGTVFAGLARTAGEFDEAEAVIAEAMDVTTPLDLVNAHAEFGMLKAETGRDVELREHVSACRHAMTPEDWLGLGARVDLLEAISELWLGNEESAMRLFQSATSRMAALQYPWDVAEAHHQYGLALARTGQRTEAEAHFVESGRILERVYAGKSFFERLARARSLFGDSPPDSQTNVRLSSFGAVLSAREAEVLALVAEGRSNREIAGVLVLSEATVATHVRHILEKTGAANRTEAAALAFRHGFANHQT
ncbi:MAG: AAA family ATPase [Dehalococcoidia bacterium]|nr:AAA family ATPase [Dehalococcoidia bacterium]